MIAILAPEADVHARAVAHEIECRGGNSVVLDTRASHEHAWHWDVEEGPVVRLGDGRRVALDECSAIWLRRPHAARPPDRVRHPDDRTFVRAEWRHLLDGVLAASPATLVNRPAAELRATKPRQLQAARAAGLPVPDTVITNDPDEVLDFVGRHDGEIVHKALSGPPHLMIDTRRWDPADARHLPTLAMAPVVFQEEITGAYDVRATVVGDQVLAARFDTRKSPVDARLDLAAPCSAYELPSDVREALLRCMDDLGLDYGAADLKIDDKGRHVFLEVNPGGQFLYVEILTGLPISAAVAELLLR